MKVTLVQPRYVNIWEAIGLGYIAAYCKKNFKGPLEIEYYQGYFDSDELIVSKAKTSDVVGFSCTSPTFKSGLSLAQRIKEINPNVRTVFGGYHPTALKEKVSQYHGVDQVIVGEGEKAFLSILNGNTEKIVTGKPVQFSELPHPDRDVIKNHREVDLCYSMIGKRIASFQSARVCPFQCIFCSERIITGAYNKLTNPIRLRDDGDLLDEIQAVVKKYKLDMFKFVDATWNTSVDKVINFCKRKIAQKDTTEWECNIHAALTNEEMFYWMKEASCIQINVGCESGSPKILKKMKKGITVDKIADVFSWAKKYEIARRGFFSIGMPDESLEDIRLTEKLVEEIRPDVFGVTILCPYPGSELYDDKKFSDIDWSGADEYSNDFWRTEHFSNQELKYWQNYLVEKFKDNLAWRHKVAL